MKQYDKEWLREYLRQECSDAGSITAWSAVHDIPPSYTSKVIRGTESAGPKVLKALNLKKVVRYREVE